MRSSGNSSGLAARLKGLPVDGSAHIPETRPPMPAPHGRVGKSPEGEKGAVEEKKSPEVDEGRFVQVPMSVILHPRLSDGARVLYALLLSYDWQDGDGRRKGKAWPSLARLAERSGKSTRQVTRYLRELEEEDVIHTKHGGGHRATRHLLARPGVDQ